MLGVFVLALAVVMLYRALAQMAGGTTQLNQAVMRPVKVSPRVRQMLDYANRLYAEKKFGPAEKAYLEVLKHDHKNALAYSRLGMIYSRLKNYDDAIECFQIAAQFSPSASSFNNLGLVYFENKNYIKSIAAFEKAIIFEPSPPRYISLAKSLQKTGNWSKVAQALEKAVEMQPSKDHLWLLAEAYRNGSQKIKAEQTLRQILELDPADAKAKRTLDLVKA